MNYGVFLNEEKLYIHRRKSSSKKKMIHGLYNAYNRLWRKVNQLRSPNMEDFKILYHSSIISSLKLLRCVTKEIID